MTIGALAAAAMVAQIETRSVDLKDGSSIAAQRDGGKRAFKSPRDLKTLGADESAEREGERSGEEEARTGK